MPIMFKRERDKIEGTIVASEVAKMTGGGASGAGAIPIEPKYRYVVEYRVADGGPQRAEVMQAWGLQTPRMINPPGSIVPLLLNARSAKVEFDWKDPRIGLEAQYKADKARRHSDFEEKLHGR
jgi:hypothetical protein